MACGDYSELYEYWANLQFFDGANCYYENQLGAAPTQFIIFTILGMSLYLYSRRPIVPLVVAIIYGGVFIAPMPAAMQNAATLIGVVMTAIVVMILIARARGGRQLG